MTNFHGTDEDMLARSILMDAWEAAEARDPDVSTRAVDDTSLVRHALQRANEAVGQASHVELLAAIRLLDSARNDLNTLEVALVLTSRAEGVTWSDIAGALGLRSPQAAQQRYQRASRRPTLDAGATLDERQRDG